MLLGHRDYPCILFLEGLQQKKYVSLPLQGLSQIEILDLLRQTFNVYYNETNKKPLDRIATLKKQGALQKVINEILVRLKLPNIKFMRSVARAFMK